MAKLGIDISAVKSPFEPLPEGNLHFRVIGAELKMSKKSNNPMVEYIYEVIGHPKLAGRQTRSYAVLDQQSGQYLIHQHCLIAGDDPTDPDPQKHLNSEFEAEVRVEEGDRGPQNRVVPLVDVAAYYQQLESSGGDFTVAEPA